MKLCHILKCGFPLIPAGLDLDTRVISLRKHALYSLLLLSIDSLVMISIEKSETNKKRALEIRDKFVSDHGQC